MNDATPYVKRSLSVIAAATAMTGVAEGDDSMTAAAMNELPLKPLDVEELVGYAVAATSMFLWSATHLAAAHGMTTQELLSQLALGYQQMLA